MFHEVNVACALLAIIAYTNTLKADFTYDDAPAIVTNEDVHGTTPLSQIFFDDFWGVPVVHAGSHKSYRPLCTLSYRLNFMVGDLNPFGYHLVNVLFHAIATGLVTFTAGRLFQRALPSIIAGTVFALHPIHTEAVAGIVGRADIGASIFFLLSFNCYVTYCIRRDLTSAEREDAYLVLSIVFAGLSMLFKELGITVLGVNMVFDIVRLYQTSRFSRPQNFVKKYGFPSLFKGIALQVLCGMILLAFRLGITGGTPHFAPSDNPAASSDSTLTRVLTFLYLPAFNMWLLLNPTILCFDWSMDAIPLIESIYDWRNVYTLLFYFSFFPFAFYLWREMEIERLFVIMFGNPTNKIEPGAQTNGANRSRGGQYKVKRNKGLRKRLITSNQQVPDTDNQDEDGWGNDDVIVVPHVLTVVTSFSMLILPFVPASNLFFHVGFVVAERILYIPSIGYCLLLAMGFNQMYVEYVRWDRTYPYHLVTQVYKAMFYCGLILLLSVFFCRLHERNFDWMSDERLFQSGISVNPAKAWSNLATVLKEERRIHEAEQAYLESLKYHPEWTDASYNYGVLLQDMGRLEEAVKQYRDAVKYHPKMAIANLNLGFVLAKLKRFEEAEKVYRYTASLDEKHSRHPKQQLTGIISALGYLGKMQLEQGRHQEAVETFQEALRRRPHYYEPGNFYNMLGDAYSKLPDLVNAEKFYKKAMSYNPSNSRTHLAYALTLAKLERYADAEAYFERAKLLEPLNMQIYELYTNFLNERGRPQDAVDMLRRAMDGISNSYHLNFYMGTTLRGMGDTQQAEDYYREIVSLQPNNPTALRDLGAILHTNQKPEEAIPYYEKALQLVPDDTATLDNLRISKGVINSKKQRETRELVIKANALNEAGKPDEAEVLFRKIVELTPEDKTAHSNLGAILHINGKPEEAEQAYYEALKISPDDEVVNSNMKKAQRKIKQKKQEKAKELLGEANALKEAGELDDAEKLFRKIVELIPEDTSALKNLGSILHMNNKLEEAERLYMKILDKDLNDKSAKKNLLKTQNKIKVQWEEKARELLAQAMDLKKAGDIQDAEEVFLEIVKLTPEDAKAHRNLGDILRMNKKLTEARHSYQEALRLKPGDPLATQYLEETQKALEEIKKKDAIDVAGGA